ncbi:MAG TPA: hypothetical protein VL361_19545 [Candidatus Limnocylindrales bacterium]|nr:hypothetical protein [Candidatus Limnocylindrales bacterium]
MSVAGFAVWALAGSWFRLHGGEIGLYAASTVVFCALAGLLMHPLVNGPRPVERFYGVFLPAFLVYAVVWCSFWFLLRFGTGEWLGSLAGSFALVAVIGWRFANLRSVPKVSVAFFTAHSLGYFAGGKVMQFLTSPVGADVFNGLAKAQLGTVAKLSWGLLYGLGFGAGLGYAFFVFQKPGLRGTGKEAIGSSG